MLKDLVKGLAFELKKAETIEDIQSMIIIYLHDLVTGLARGQPGPLICLAAKHTEEDADHQELQIPDVPTTVTATYSQVAQRQETAQPDPNKETDLNVIKGDKKGKGKGKGYGECWHCGQWGHPRRECPELLKQQAGTVAALKGKGKGKGKGSKGYTGYKGGKGYGHGNSKGGKGKGGYSGKGVNYYGEDDYYNAWGGDGTPGDDWGWETEGYYGGMGNLVFMMEAGGKSGQQDPRRAQTNIEGPPPQKSNVNQRLDNDTTQRLDNDSIQRLDNDTIQRLDSDMTPSLTQCDTEMVQLQLLAALQHGRAEATTHNRYQALQEDDEDVDDEQLNDTGDMTDGTMQETMTKKHILIRRQRRRRRATMQCKEEEDQIETCQNFADGLVQHEEMSDNVVKGWQPGQEHIGYVNNTHDTNNHNNNQNHHNSQIDDCTKFGSSAACINVVVVEFPFQVSQPFQCRTCCASFGRTIFHHCLPGHMETVGSSSKCRYCVVSVVVVMFCLYVVVVIIANCSFINTDLHGDSHVFSARHWSPK